MWATIHPLADPLETDQMTTEYATSMNGLDWTWQGTALRPPRRVGLPRHPGNGGALRRAVGHRVLRRPGQRPENYEERTGVALGTDPAGLTATSPPGAGPAVSPPYRGGGLRSLELVELPDQRTRLYYEMTQPDGSRAPVTELR